MKTEAQWTHLTCAIASEDWPRVSELAVELYLALGGGAPPPHIAQGEGYPVALWNWKLTRHACVLAESLAREYNAPCPSIGSEPIKMDSGCQSG